VERFDFVVIGAGAAGEAAIALACGRGASAAIVEEDLFGGSCAYWACMPSKALLHAAAVHHGGGDFPWQKASDFRDWMIDREGIDYPDDRAREQSYRSAGGVPIRGRARIVGPGRVDVALTGGGERQLEAGVIVIAIGSGSRIPSMEGLDRIRAWTNRDGTSARQLPRSLLIMGGGPTGVELAQVYTRYGVSVTILDPNERLVSRDHPRNSAALTEALTREGVTVRTGVRALSVEPEAGPEGAHLVTLSDSTAAFGHEVLVAIGRQVPWEGLGIEALGLSLADGPPRPDERLRVAKDVYVVGDPAGPELHTHLAHYEGEMAVRIALGDDVIPDFRAIPRATYTDPETASVGLRLDEAEKAGHDAIERTADIGTAAKGYVTQSGGHVTLVVDRADRTLLGAFIAGQGASEAIHEAVLAVKLRTPIAVLADTLHAFPTTARVMGTLFNQINRELDPPG
jgi:pyruvate/2-oxoglutarate dehydrogenase complex dihydrolipoamide dehydrogenase (E3) component